MDPFRIDPARLYDVRPDGRVETAVAIPDSLIAQHRARLRRWWVGAVLLNALTMGTTVAAVAVLGWGVAARIAILALLAFPLLAVAPALARFAAPGASRRHHARPRDFPKP